MKFLISNYSTPFCTEPHYINRSLNMIDGVESNMLNNSSIYDNFDTYNPDFFITHINQLTKDVLFYILNEQKNIQLLINVDTIPNEAIDQINTSLLGKNIKFIFFGSEARNINNVKYLQVMHGADIFLKEVTPSSKLFNISQLIFVDSEDQIDKAVKSSRHYTTNLSSLENKVDFIVPIFDIHRLFNNYDEIIFCGESYIGTQISFDAIFSGTKVIFDTKDSAALDKIDFIFKKQKLFTSVKNKHTCLHRTKYILSNLSLNNLSDKINEVIEKI